MIEMKDLYIFGEAVYFSIIGENEELYFKGLGEDFNKIQILKDKKFDIEFQIETLKNIKKMTRGEYYDALKRSIKTYCNFEKIQRVWIKLKKVVSFTASWCGPCNMIKPILKKLSEEEKNYMGESWCR